MRTKTKKRKYISPDEFYVARRKAGLTVKLAAETIDIDERTIRNWENGKSKIPYAAFRLIRLMAGYSIIGKGWENWSFWRGKLCSPEGREFQEHEMHYIGHYLSFAKHQLKAQASPVADASIRPAFSRKSLELVKIEPMVKVELNAQPESLVKLERSLCF